MIKRIRFATRKSGVSPGQFAPRWPDAMEASASAPVDARPLRIAVCTSLPDVISDPVHDGIGIEWFTDAEHLDRFESWLAGAGGDSVFASLDAAIDVGASPVVVARQLVLRGADWLENRWRSGGARLKHMAIARRAAELSPEEFSERWKSRAGSLKSADTGHVVEIPAKARRPRLPAEPSAGHARRGLGLRRPQRGLLRRARRPPRPDRLVRTEPRRPHRGGSGERVMVHRRSRGRASRVLVPCPVPGWRRGARDDSKCSCT